MPSNQRKRILFVAEAVTLAHVARPLTLAQALDPNHYEVLFAVDPRYRWLLRNQSFRVQSIRSIPSEQFLTALTVGSPVYDTNMLHSYIKEDLQIINEFDPDLIVGDFRLSLSVSAAVAKKKYAAIANAYWSPYAKPAFTIPEHRLVNIVGENIAQILFSMARPFIFAYHARPLNRVRKDRGLPSLGRDLRRIYTEADFTLYADHPRLHPTFHLPSNHRYLGPICWSPEVSWPKEWGAILEKKPFVFVNLGSSGRMDFLPRILEALESLQVTALVATSGRSSLKSKGPRIYIADYLSGEVCAAQAELVISNGGSLSVQQALGQGTPVIGIVSNLDQHLNMQPVHDLGTGLKLRSEKVTVSSIRLAIHSVLVEDRFRKKAKEWAQVFSTLNAAHEFRAFVDEVTAPQKEERP